MIIAVVLFIVIFLIIIGVVFYNSNNNNSSSSSSGKGSSSNYYHGSRARKVNGVYIGDATWNGIGIPINPLNVQELRMYTVAITGAVTGYHREEIVSSLGGNGINILLGRKSLSTDLWLLGKDGTQGASKLRCIKPSDRVIKEEDLINLLNKIKKNRWRVRPLFSL